MHTTHIEHEGETFPILHDGDYDGDTNFVLPGERIQPLAPDPDGSVRWNVAIPFDVLAEFVGLKIANDLIATVEELGGRETLAFLAQRKERGVI